ncbi:MAG TPA: hypothetical protein VEI97_17505, partial [bacterium]|nr:hypothetical protein [bacterium]
MPRSPHSPLPALIGMILAIGLLGCSGGSKGPLAPDLAGPVGPIATSQPWQTGASSAFGVLSGTLYPDGRIEERVVRTGAAVGDIVDLDATEFFTQAPCRDCVKVTGVTHEPGTNNLMVSVAIRHPFSGALPRRDLHIFDVRGIFILPGTTVFNVLTAPINTGLETTETQSLQGDPGFITNADGFTTHFDYRAEDPRYVPDPVPVPGNLNPFKRYFVDPSMGPFQPAAPAGWNVCPMGADYETQTYILDRTRLTAPVNFAFVVDARW